MPITDYKLKESDFASTGAEALPDKVVGQADYVKGMIDGPSKDVIMPKYNGLIDAMVAEFGKYMPKSGGTMTGDIAPSAANTCHVGITSRPFEYVTAKDYYAHGGRFLSRNPSNMTGDFIALDYANHKVQNAHSTDAMKLCSSPGVHVMNIGASGFTEIKASAFTQVSSVRYKDILGDLPPERARKILDLDLVKYRYKAEIDDNPKTHYGITAEQADDLELWDIVEYSIHDGQPEAVDYSKLTPYLIGIAKDHDGRIAALETAVQALMEKNEQLEAKAAKLDALSALLVEKGILTQEEIDARGE